MHVCGNWLGLLWVEILYDHLLRAPLWVWKIKNKDVSEDLLPAHTWKLGQLGALIMKWLVQKKENPKTISRRWDERVRPVSYLFLLVLTIRYIEVPMVFMVTMSKFLIFPGSCKQKFLQIPHSSYVSWNCGFHLTRQCHYLLLQTVTISMMGIKDPCWLIYCLRQEW